MAEHKHAAAHEESKKGHEEPKKGEVSAELHDLTAAVKGDLTKLAGPKADKAITHWQTTLESIGQKGIAGELGKLKTLVTDKEPDGAKIGKSLTGLGDHVAKLAEEQGGVVGTALKSLAGALHKGADSLTAKA